MTDTSPRTPCSDRSAVKRAPLIGTKATADFHQGAQSPCCIADAVYMAVTEVMPDSTENPCPAGAIHTGFERKAERRLRYPTSEKLKIIQLVESSHQSIKRTLQQIGVSRPTLYRWYDLYHRFGG